MDNRLIHIRKRLGEYAVGKFHNKPIIISRALDETDAIMTGINILGEELQSVSISRNYFNDIFNTVSDMVFLCNKKGQITDCNKSARLQLGFIDNDINGMQLEALFNGPFPAAKQIITALKKSPESFPREYNMMHKNGQLIGVSIKAGIVNDGRQEDLLLLTATDIMYRQKAENLIIRAIIDTQEMERQRLAKDLHDSLAQQISGIGFYISTTAHALKSKEHKATLLKSNQILKDVMTEIRNICFNLMPGTLREFGLVKAIKECCYQYITPTGIQYELRCPDVLPVLCKELQIDIYRIIQELITNVVKHAAATRITITIHVFDNVLQVWFADNGKGFNKNKTGKGMGLQNIRSRVKSHNGTLHVKSSLGKGTGYKIMFSFFNH